MPYPSTPDAFYLVSYLPLTVALFWLGRPVVPSRDLTTMIDAISLTLGGSLVVWITVVRPAIVGRGHGQVPASPASPVGRLRPVLAASVRVVLAWRRNSSVTVLGMAVLGFLIAEIFYGNALVAGRWVVGGPVDVGYFAFTFLCGAAALEPSMRDVASPPDVRHTLGPVRLTLIAASLLVAPTALLVEVERGGCEPGSPSPSSRLWWVC